MDPSIIPSASIALSTYNTQQVVDTSLLKDTMNLSQKSSDMLIQSLNANLGQLMDVSA